MRKCDLGMVCTHLGCERAEKEWIPTKKSNSLFWKQFWKESACFVSVLSGCFSYLWYRYRLIFWKSGFIVTSARCPNNPVILFLILSLCSFLFYLFFRTFIYHFFRHTQHLSVSRSTAPFKSLQSTNRIMCYFNSMISIPSIFFFSIPYCIMYILRSENMNKHINRIFFCPFFDRIIKNC